jgi:hypothetical protein
MGSLKQYALTYEKSLFVLLLLSISFSQEIALVKYSGGGGMPILLHYNLIKYCNANINTKINTKPATVDLGVLIYFLILPAYDRTWKCRCDVKSIINTWLLEVFFIDDNYGMDQYIRKVKKYFPIMHL